jgi:hypothetical protein
MKKRILLPLLAFILALGAAFGTEVIQDDSNLFASVEYKSGITCAPHPDCSTSPNAQMCTNTFKVGTNCLSPIPSWRP